jgi:hypothetical protein
VASVFQRFSAPRGRRSGTRIAMIVRRCLDPQRLPLEPGSMQGRALIMVSDVALNSANGCDPLPVLVISASRSSSRT